MADSPRPLHGLDRAALGVGALATVLRLVWTVLFARTPRGLSDPLLYHGFALRLAAGRGYVSLGEHLTAYYPPGYPFFLGGLYRAVDAAGLDGHRALVVGIAQSLLWGIAAVAVVVAGRAVLGRREGVVAGLIVACWPNLIAYATAVLSESLFVCCFAVFTAAVSVAAVEAGGRSGGGGGGGEGVASHRWWWSVGVAAVSLAAATMVRPQVLLTLVAVAVAWLVGGLGWRRSAALVLACTVALAVVVVPWAVRNHRVFGHVVPISTNTGDNLCVGFQDDATGGFTIRPRCDTGEFYTDGPEAEYRHDVETRRLAWEWVRRNPGQLPWLSVEKLYQTFRTDDDGLRGTESYGADVRLDEPWRSLWVGIATAYYAAVMLLALAGSVRVGREGWHRPRDPARLALLGATVAGVLVVVVFFGDPRFKVPTTPLFALLAAAGLAWVTARPGRGAPVPATPPDDRSPPR